MKKSMPTGRYVKRNAHDYLLMAVLFLLLFSFLFRGIGAILFAREDRTCRAEIDFVIEGVNREAALLLSISTDPFSFVRGGQELEDVRYEGYAPSYESAIGPDGQPTQQPSQTRFDVTFRLRANGVRARDGHFLLEGYRRISDNSTHLLLRGGAQYTAKIKRVTVL